MMMDFKWVKHCVAVTACMTCLVSVSQADEVVPVCGTAGAAVVVHVSRSSLKAQFRCGAGLSNLDPPVHSGNVYGDHGCVTPVKLSSRMPGAQVVCSSKVHNLHTFSVTALPTGKSQLFYYRCISSDRKRVCDVIVNVPVDSTTKDEHAAESELAICSEPGKTVVSYMSRVSKRAFFKCSPELSGLDPPAASGAVYTNPKGSSAVPLATLAPGVLVNLSPDNPVYVLALLTLPKSGFKNYYYRCVSPVSHTQACTVNIVVPSDPVPGLGAHAAVRATSITPVQGRRGSRGHQGLAKGVRTCSVHGKAIVSPLSPHTLSAHFTCPPDLAVLDPPVLTGSVYVDKSCSRALPLRSLWGGSLHMSPGLSASYTVRMTKLPPYESQAIFYKCRSPQTSQECLVEIKIPSALDNQSENQLVKASGTIPVCTNAGGVVEVNVDVYSRNATFRCGGGFPALDPSVTSGNVYTTRSCKVPMSVEDHLGVGVNVSETSENLYTVSLLELPKEESKRFYYLCKDLSGRGICRVVIHVPRKLPRRPSGFRAESSKLHVCHAGPDAAIRVTLHAHEGIRLTCGPGLTIQPHTLEEVFDNTDGTCSSLSTLQSLVPGAQLLSAFGDAENPVAGRNLVFLVDEPPHQRRELCYHCASSVHVKAHGCRILLTVQGSELNSKPDLGDNTPSHLSSSDRALSGAKWSTIFAVVITLIHVANSMNVVI